MTISRLEWRSTKKRNETDVASPMTISPGGQPYPPLTRNSTGNV
jgi:hypothetical protein